VCSCRFGLEGREGSSFAGETKVDVADPGTALGDVVS
jgi:hypothetical protein